jgi:hypothetical protein
LRNTARILVGIAIGINLNKSFVHRLRRLTQKI